MIGRSPYGDCVPPSPKFYNNKVDIIDKSHSLNVFINPLATRKTNFSLKGFVFKTKLEPLTTFCNNYKD